MVHWALLIYKTNVLNDVMINQAKTMDLLTRAGDPYGPSGSIGLISEADAIKETVSGLLDYNIYATNNGRPYWAGIHSTTAGRSIRILIYIPALNELVHAIRPAGRL